jgi:hypothetical protein
MRGSDGNLYGSAASFTSQATGFVFRLTLDGTLMNLHQFPAAEGYSPISGLVELPNGELAGVTFGSRFDSAAAGTVFAVGAAVRFARGIVSTALTAQTRTPRCFLGATARSMARRYLGDPAGTLSYSGSSRIRVGRLQALVPTTPTHASSQRCIWTS